MSFGPFYVGDSPAVALDIVVSRNGQLVDLSPYDEADPVATDPNGQPLDWDVDTTIVDATSTVEVPFPVPSPFAIPGVFTLQVRLIDTATGANELTSPNYISVLLPGQPTAWASPADVDNLTGMTVTDAQLSQAQGLVELFSGTTIAASAQGLIASKNLRLLRNAVSYQAAWIADHPDLFVNVDVRSISQDGASATLTHANARLLAPLAKRCIDRLSWFLPGSLQAIPFGGIPSMANTIRDRDHDSSDIYETWYPIGERPGPG